MTFWPYALRVMYSSNLSSCMPMSDSCGMSLNTEHMEIVHLIHAWMFRSYLSFVSLVARFSLSIAPTMSRRSSNSRGCSVREKQVCLLSKMQDLYHNTLPLTCASIPHIVWCIPPPPSPPTPSVKNPINICTVQYWVIFKPTLYGTCTQVSPEIDPNQSRD